MRLRNIKGADEAVANSPFCIQSPTFQKGIWHTYLHNQHPIHIEIGMGKGQFIMALAARHPEINYIGIERYTSVLLRALQKMEKEVDRIYLNFSDPWPKDRHAKRRLTSGSFLEIYQQILAPGGHIEFKTDNRKLFDFSLEEIPAAGWHIDAHTFDLHRDTDMNTGNIMTEYEEKFSTLGNPICKLIASP